MPENKMMMVMIHEDKWRDGLDEAHKKLKGKRIPVELSTKEIELILTALSTYEESLIITDLNEIAASIGDSGLHENIQQEIQSKIAEAFGCVRAKESKLELLHKRLTNAVRTALSAG